MKAKRIKSTVSVSLSLAASLKKSWKKLLIRRPYCTHLVYSMGITHALAIALKKTQDWIG
jgi:hypothetical protein